MTFGVHYAMLVSGIYKIANTLNGKFYVGSSVNVQSRILKHLSNLRAGVHKNAHLQAAFAQYGETAFDFVLLETCEQDALLRREQRYIDALKPEYNVCPIAGNTLGYRHTPEGKAKMSVANKGNQHFLGKRHSEESKRKMAQAAIGRKLSPAHVARIIEANTGNKWCVGRELSEQHRAKVSATLLNSWGGASGAKPRSKEAAAERLRAQWANPEWKAQQAQRIRDGKAAKRAANGVA